MSCASGVTFSCQNFDRPLAREVSQALSPVLDCSPVNDSNGLDRLASNGCAVMANALPMDVTFYVVAAQLDVDDFDIQLRVRTPSGGDDLDKAVGAAQLVTAQALVIEVARGDYITDARHIAGREHLDHRTQHGDRGSLRWRHCLIMSERSSGRAERNDPTPCPTLPATASQRRQTPVRRESHALGLLSPCARRQRCLGLVSRAGTPVEQHRDAPTRDSGASPSATPSAVNGQFCSDIGGAAGAPTSPRLLELFAQLVFHHLSGGVAGKFGDEPHDARAFVVGEPFGAESLDLVVGE